LPVAPQRLAMAGIKRLVFNPNVSFDKQRSRLRIATQASGGAKVLQSLQVAGVRCEEYTPTAVSTDSVIVYVHGGGYCVGSPALGAPFITALSDALGAKAILVDYRLAPEAPAPAAVDDVSNVLQSLGANVVTVGDSAGAGALVAALQRNTALAAVLLSPWLDLSDDRLGRLDLVERDPVLSPEWLEMCASAYAGGDRSNPLVSPLLGDLTLPPTLVVGGTDDVLAPDATRLVEVLSRQGAQVNECIIHDMWHDFALSVGRLEVADFSLDEVVKFLKPLLRR
jgi:monoterpene epsilon-lactone hydrolase